MREVWKSIPLLNGDLSHEVSSLGRVRRVLPDGSGRIAFLFKPMKPYFDGRYWKFRLYVPRPDGIKRRRSLYVHDMVASAFLGLKPDGKDVNHKDFDKLNNKYRNLEYATKSQNMLHALVHGAKMGLRGEDHRDAKLTAEIVKKVRRIYAGVGGRFGVIAELGRRYGVSATTIHHV